MAALGGKFDPAEATEANTQLLIRDSFVFSQLTAHVSANAVGATNLRFRKNGANGNQNTVITASGTGYFTDTTNTDSVIVDDLANLQIITPATGGTVTMIIRSVGIVQQYQAAANAIERALATETISISEAAFTRLAAKIRTRTDTAIVVGETRARLSAKMRPLSTQTVVLSENVIRVKGKVKSLATETITVTGGTIARLLAKIRTPAPDTTTISETRQRLGSKSRPLSTQTSHYPNHHKG